MCRSQWCWYLREEFSLKNFGLQGIQPARFAYLQWRIPIGVVLAYRVIVAAYCMGWLIYTSRFPDILINGAHIKQYAFLTMWTYLVLTIYFLLHCLVCIVYAWNRGSSPCRAPSWENHRRLFQELEVQPSLWGSRDYTFIPQSDFDEGSDMESRRPVISRLQKVVWVLYNIASVACIMVTVIFWTMLYPGMDIHGIDLVINFQLHAVTSILIFIETVVTAVPVRLLHFVHTLVYGLIYIVFSGIYYAVDHRAILYPDVLDWSQPGKTVVVLVVTAFVGLPFIQLCLYIIYKLRMLIYNKCAPDID